MAVVKRIVCLANSRKFSGRCVAGKEIADGRVASWIRPVSARRGEEVSEHERQYQDGSDPRVMDVVDIPLLEFQPKHYRQENWLLDPKQYWVKVGRAECCELDSFVDPAEALWTNGHSTSTGVNDRIPLPTAVALRSSLRLVRVESLTLFVSAPGEVFGNPKRRVQGRFRYRQTDYWLWVTDPKYERA